ncbi:MAG: RNA polymerase sigma factor [Gemmataceae bacterium]
MAGMSLQDVVRRLRRDSASEEDDDAQLLAAFALNRDEAVFDRLVGRHGPLVLGVCRRLLRDEHDAEDAFQATFLALAREVGHIGRGALAGWLHRLAFRVALKLRARSRRAGPLPGEVPERAAGPEAEVNELQDVLDEELSRLPAKFRRTFILCCLQGRSNSEAAREIDCPRGTVDSRLAGE